MRELIDRYIDGELTPSEAEAFLAALGRDPELEAELHATERMLAAVASAQTDEPAADFTDRVMARLPGGRRGIVPFAPVASRADWVRPAALAASILIVFGIGFLSARLTGRPVGDELAPQQGLTLTANLDPASHTPGISPAGADGMRLVRLVYVPQGVEVSQVAVAGTFNGWNPAQTPMQKEGSVWTALLLLPEDTYEYMFVINGQDWRTDPLALQTRDDGFGRMNAVLDLSS